MGILEYIEKHKLSQAEFAGMIGTEPATVSRYISGDRIPKPDIARTIVKETDGSVTWEDIYG